MKKILIGLIVVILVAVGGVFLVFDSMLKTGIETAGSSILGTSVTLGSIGISPLSGSGGIKELRIGNAEGYSAPYAMELGALDVKINVGSVLSDVIEIESIIIQRPEITYETRITTDNIRALLDNIGGGGSGEAASEESAGGGKKVIIRDFKMIDPQVNLVAIIGQAPISLPDIHLQNIGEKDASVTVAEAGRQILGALNKALLGANLPTLDEVRERVEEEIGAQVEQLENKLEEEVGNQVENLTDRVRKLF